MKQLLILILAISPFFLFAGEQEGKVLAVVARGDGAHYVTLSGKDEAKPGCHNSNFPIWVIKDENSTLGKSQFAMLIAAKTSGNTIKIKGTNACTRWHDAEDIDYVVMK